MLNLVFFYFWIYVEFCFSRKPYKFAFQYEYIDDVCSATSFGNIWTNTIHPYEENEPYVYNSDQCDSYECTNNQIVITTYVSTECKIQDLSDSYDRLSCVAYKGFYTKFDCLEDIGSVFTSLRYLYDGEIDYLLVQFFNGMYSEGDSFECTIPNNPGFYVFPLDYCIRDANVGGLYHKYSQESDQMVIRHFTTDQCTIRDYGYQIDYVKFQNCSLYGWAGDPRSPVRYGYLKGSTQEVLWPDPMLVDDDTQADTQADDDTQDDTQADDDTQDDTDDDDDDDDTGFGFATIGVFVGVLVPVIVVSLVIIIVLVCLLIFFGYRLCIVSKDRGKDYELKGDKSSE